MAALFAVACSKTLDLDAVKTAISTGIEAQSSLPIASVTCPDRREMKANDTFDCTAVPQMGGKLTVTVTQKDANGTANWAITKTEGLLDLTSLEAQVKSGLKEQADLEATVSCGGQFRAIEPGKSFDCAVEAGDSKATVTVTMKDTEGKVSWSLNQ